MKTSRLYFNDLALRLKTKFAISRVWFISLNMANATLVIWKHVDPDPVKCDILLKCISNTSKLLEVLAMKDGGTFVRLTLEPKLMDRQQSKIALGGDLLSAKDSQVHHECHGPPVDPHAAATAAPRKVAAAAATVETDSEEEREVQRDIKASQRHEAARMAEAKAAKSGRSGRDKGKNVVPEAPKKKPFVPSQAPREKLLGSSIAAQSAWLSRESKTDSGKRKRESHVTPPPPPVVVPAETSEEEEDISSDKEQGEATDSGSDSPVPSQPVNKKGSKLKTLKQMDKSHMDREKQDIQILEKAKGVWQAHPSWAKDKRKRWTLALGRIRKLLMEVREDDKRKEEVYGGPEQRVETARRRIEQDQSMEAREEFKEAVVAARRREQLRGKPT
ncbi:hypothetical protein R1sor_005924 [Riccia sorocarpa]|uniref:Uncharacterized protein n=1 Tax=Riccia sorocarpa TaxID=122646 RepID=A0ABD3HLG6_9MARC